MSGQRASIHVMFRCSKRERAMKNHEIAVSGSPPKAEATGSNPVGCATNQQLSEGFGGHISAASELCPSHANPAWLRSIIPQDQLAELDQIYFEAGEREAVPLSSVVYFIGQASGAVKIGFTTILKKRAGMLRRETGGEVSILATRPGGRRLEQAYHWLFAAHRLHGEWFARHPDILAEITRLNEQVSA